MFLIKACTASMAENKGTSNVNDVPLLAVDVPNQNLERHDDVSLFSKLLNSVY